MQDGVPNPLPVAEPPNAFHTEIGPFTPDERVALMRLVLRLGHAAAPNTLEDAHLMIHELITVLTGAVQKYEATLEED